jgi:hypothetical protein
MTRATPLALASLAALATGCPSSPSGNASVLWLAPYMSETRVQLVDAEPEPY